MDLSKAIAEINDRIRGLDSRLEAVTAARAAAIEEIGRCEAQAADLQRLRTELTELVDLARRDADRSSSATASLR